MEQSKMNKIKKIMPVLIILILTVILIICIIRYSKLEEQKSKEIIASTTSINETKKEEKQPEKIIDDWRLTLANSEHILPEDFSIELASIDETRKFDKRAIGELNQMIKAMQKEKITKIWVQSAYRSVERQTELYNDSVEKYIKKGKSQEEAEKLTLQFINKPGGSDHNIGLGVDFNNVDKSFAKTEAFTWLQEHAQEYGFVLRYPEEKEEITKITYEPWHWRYVGQEHAKVMNEKNMCLEEYVEYLKQI